MSNEIQAQRAFWNSEADAFQSIYTHRKSKFFNTLDQIFRKDMYERYQFTIANCEPTKGRTFLDVGCGNALYSLEIARKGAAKVVGIDISEVMIGLCKKSSDAELRSFLTTGLTADGDVPAKEMGEVIANTTSQLTPDDLGAMIAYLRSLPPLPEEGK